MPTLQCPNCGNTVRFEGVAGICPSCASVVMVPKSDDAPPPPRPVPKTGRPSLDALTEFAGSDPEIFEPEMDQPRTIGGMDPGVVITLGIVGVVLVAFAVFVMVHSLSSGVPGNAAMVRAPGAPPSLLTLPEQDTPAVAPPPPPRAPPRPATKPVPPPAWTRVRPLRPTLTDANVLTDRKVTQSIDRAVHFLLTKYRDGKLPPGAAPSLMGGDALCTYALLHASQSIDEPQLDAGAPLMSSMLEQLKRFEFTSDQTYSHSLRAAALALLNRPVDRTALRADLQWLLKAANKGAYSYDTGATSWDNSNSQYGMLGVWAAADADLGVPRAYWEQVEQHWVSSQLPTGAWAYYATSGPELTMTAAGVTTLTVASEQIGGLISDSSHDDKPWVTKAIDKGVAWMDEADHAVDLGQWEGYALYGMERAALATGYKFFGQHDWYRELANKELSSQQKDGSWTGSCGDTEETAFRVLFLSRGRQPLIMNKLRFDGGWNNRPHDLTRLAEFCTARLEQPFAWGVVDLNRNWWDWLDAPVLMLTTDEPPQLTDEMSHKLRSYVDNGGLLFIHNEFGTQENDEFVAELASRAFPEYKMHVPAPGDLIFNSAVKLESPPKVRIISSADRALVVYSPTDITRGWVNRRTKQINKSSEFGLDLVVYAAGKDGFRHRLDDPYVAPSTVRALGTIPVARVQYPGVWDPEPAAWTHFARNFQNQTSAALDVRAMDAGQLNPRVTPVATLTGATAVDFSKVDLKPLRKYVDGGGVLFIDACGGSVDFAKSVREQLLPKLFGDVQFEGLDPAAPVLAGAGDCMDPLPKPLLRQSAILRLQGIPAAVDAAAVGKGMVFVSDLDVTAGLLDVRTLSIVGYTPQYSQSLMKNVLLWAVSRYRR